MKVYGPFFPEHFFLNNWLKISIYNFCSRAQQMKLYGPFFLMHFFQNNWMKISIHNFYIFSHAPLSLTITQKCLTAKKNSK